MGEVGNTNPTRITGFGDADKPTSIDIDVSGNGSLSCRAYVNGKCVFATVPFICSSGVVRHYKFRTAKGVDYGSGAEWQLASSAALQVSAVARFSRRDPIVWQKPTSEAKASDVAPPKQEELTPDELSRRWRYANSVAR